MIFKRKPIPYSQDEISQQINDIKELTILRDRSIANERLLSREDTAVYAEEKLRFTASILTAQYTLDFMQAENELWQNRRKGKR